MKRYVVTMELYVYAKDDKHAISKSKMIADRQDSQYGNRCQVTEIQEQPFASLISREVLKTSV